MILICTLDNVNITVIRVCQGARWRDLRVEWRAERLLQPL